MGRFEKYRVALNESQREVVDRVAERRFAHGDELPGRVLRPKMVGLDKAQKRELLEDLIASGRLLHSTGDLGDYFELTLLGALASRHADTFADRLDALLGFLHRRFEREPEFRRYEWGELKRDVEVMGAKLEDSDFHRVDSTIVLGGLCRGGGGQPGTDSYGWGAPDMEELEGVGCTQDLLEFRAREVTKVHEAHEARLSPNAHARLVLQVFYELYVERSSKRDWSVGPTDDRFATTRLTASGRRRGFERLKDKKLIEQVRRDGSCKLLPLGVDAVAEPGRIDRLLPVPGSPTVGSDTNGQTIEGNVSDLATNLGFLGEHDAKLRTIIQSTLTELEGALAAGLSKASILLAGSILEGVLVDVLDRRRDLASPFLKKRKFPDEASLEDLLKIAASPDLVGGQRTILSATAIAAGIGLKEHRDLIHPHRQLRDDVEVDPDVAAAMVRLLRLVVRDLAKAADEGVIKAFEEK